jgi:hypothetical protein
LLTIRKGSSNMQSRNLSILSVLSLLAACSTYSGTGSAPSAGGVESGTSTRVSGTVSAGPVSVTLSAEQTAAVRAWYGQSASGNGRGRSGGLPPGIARNLERGTPLPPGIAKQYLPQNLVVQLPSPGAGFEYLVVAGKLLLVEAATQMVRQVLLETLLG